VDIPLDVQVVATYHHPPVADSQANQVAATAHQVLDLVVQAQDSVAQALDSVVHHLNLTVLHHNLTTHLLNPTVLLLNHLNLTALLLNHLSRTVLQPNDHLNPMVLQLLPVDSVVDLDHHLVDLVHHQADSVARHLNRMVLQANLPNRTELHPLVDLSVALNLLAVIYLHLPVMALL
jgi:hypothetical protein